MEQDKGRQTGRDGDQNTQQRHGFGPKYHKTWNIQLQASWITSKRDLGVRGKRGRGVPLDVTWIVVYTCFSG
jgi:hypothetical protein